MMTCNTCGKTKPEEEFPKNGSDRYGAPRRRPDCTVCYTIKRRIDKKKHSKFVNNTKHRTGEHGTYTVVDWKEALLFFEGTCAYCGKPQSRRAKLTRDHVVPVKGEHGGGKTVRRNIAPACVSCNSSKGNDRLLDWFSKQPFFTVERQERILAWMNLT